MSVTILTKSVEIGKNPFKEVRKDFYDELVLVSECLNIEKIFQYNLRDCDLGVE